MGKIRVIVMRWFSNSVFGIVGLLIAMNRKILTSNNGPLLQITLTPWETQILLSLTAKANIPAIASVVHSDNQAVGKVVRDFYLILEKSK